MPKPKWVGYAQVSLTEEMVQDVETFTGHVNMTIASLDALIGDLLATSDRLTIDEYKGHIQLKVIQQSPLIDQLVSHIFPLSKIQKALRYPHPVIVLR